MRLRKLLLQFLLTQSGGGQLPDLVTPMASPAANGSLESGCPTPLNRGLIVLKR
jgi:hypothetical protein